VGVRKPLFAEVAVAVGAAAVEVVGGLLDLLDVVALGSLDQLIGALLHVLDVFLPLGRVLLGVLLGVQVADLGYGLAQLAHLDEVGFHFGELLGGQLLLRRATADFADLQLNVIGAILAHADAALAPLLVHPHDGLQFLKLILDGLSLGL